jgi:hypothetical protein
MWKETGSKRDQSESAGLLRCLSKCLFYGENEKTIIHKKARIALPECVL